MTDALYYELYSAHKQIRKRLSRAAPCGGMRSATSRQRREEKEGKKKEDKPIHQSAGLSCLESTVLGGRGGTRGGGGETSIIKWPPSCALRSHDNPWPRQQMHTRDPRTPGTPKETLRRQPAHDRDGRPSQDNVETAIRLQILCHTVSGRLDSTQAHSQLPVYIVSSRGVRARACVGVGG